MFTPMKVTFRVLEHITQDHETPKTDKHSPGITILHGDGGNIRPVRRRLEEESGRIRVDRTSLVDLRILQIENVDDERR